MTKPEPLVLDWREKQRTKAVVMHALWTEIQRLPAAYTKDVRVEKMARAYAHVYDQYLETGKNAL